MLLIISHRTPEGKTSHGISLKTYMDVFAADINSMSKEDTMELLSKYNLSNSVWLQTKAARPGTEMKMHILEGANEQFGRSSSLSKLSPADISGVHVNALLGHGIIPVIRTADKKTEYGVSFGDKPTLRVTKQQMLARLQGYLFDEIKTANIFNTNKTSKLHRINTFQDQGGDLRFFKKYSPYQACKLKKKIK